MLKRIAILVGLVLIVLGVFSIVNSDADDGVTYTTTTSTSRGSFDEPLDHGSTNDHQSSSTFADHTTYYEDVPAHMNDSLRDHVDHDIDNDRMPDMVDNDNW